MSQTYCKIPFVTFANNYNAVLLNKNCLIKQALNRILDIWLWEDWLCKSVWLVYYTSLTVSSFTMTAMAIER